MKGTNTYVIRNNRKIKKDIEGYKEKPEWNEVGRVIETGDGIVKILGLRNAVSQEVFDNRDGPWRTAGARTQLGRGIDRRARARRFSFRCGRRTVRRTGDILSIAVGDEMIGRVVDPLGEPQDGQGPIFKDGKSGGTSPEQSARSSARRAFWSASR